MGWISGWTYRKSHIINPASDAGQNYQKRIIVHYVAGSDNDENVYLSNKCKIDFGDVRFTDKTGVALLDYWIEKKIDSDYAIFWIEVSEDISVYNTKIFIYYGNTGASSISNGDNTFIFFDDFENDLSKWFIVGSPVLSTDYSYEGNQSVKFPPLISSVIQRIQSPYDNKAVHIHYYDQISSSLEYSVFSIDAGESEVSYIGIINDIDQYEYKLQDIVYNSGVNRSVGWHEFVTRNSNGLKQFIIDGNLMPVTGIGSYSPVTFIFGVNVSEVYSYWDTVFIRNWVNPEPTHDDWGFEESSGIGIETFTSEDIITIHSHPKSSENIINDLNSNPNLSENSILDLILQRRSLTVDDVITIPLNLSGHIPILSSEDILLVLLASRHFNIAKEFIEVINRFPIIGCFHIITTEDTRD